MMMNKIYIFAVCSYEIKSKSTDRDLRLRYGRGNLPTLLTLQSFSVGKLLRGFLFWLGSLSSFLAHEKIISVLIKSNGILNCGIVNFPRCRQLTTGEAGK